MDLFNATASLCGDDRAPLRPGSRQLRAAIGEALHYVFVLVDGVGMNLRDHFPGGGFLDTFLHGELRSIFPSTTSSVLVSLATGQWPARHGIVGWFTYLPDLGRTTVPLLFRDRFSDTPLDELGIGLGEVFPLERRGDRFDRAFRLFTHRDLIGTSFGRWSTGSGREFGFDDAVDAFDRVSAVLRADPRPSYNYVYLSTVDHEEHRRGVGSPRVHELLARLDERLMRFREEADESVRILVTSDHGHIEVPKEHRIVLRGDESLTQTLLAPPSGEPRTPLFHLKPGRRGEFLEAFHDRLSGRFDLLSVGQAERLELFGPEPLSGRARERVGDYVAVTCGRYALVYAPPGEEPLDFIGFHGGLSDEEMRVPLFLA